MQLPINPRNLKAQSLEECDQSLFLSDCSCSGYSINGSRCAIWGGGLWNLKQHANDGVNGRGIHIRHATSELVKFKGTKKRPLTVIVAIVGIVVLVLIGFIFLRI
ncbi:hypothetical protein GIB67_039152 [Kingdonia uniflora]|uniref:Apple domain-containing protein n=1 Tax=Kingdonia uniflora TaxID=39325 RepID=A0A7J7MLS5_9MAGN|nr:hypothetical protein GIB67_039152 [Kingdonia uniflora]